MLDALLGIKNAKKLATSIDKDYTEIIDYIVDIEGRVEKLESLSIKNKPAKKKNTKTKR